MRVLIVVGLGDYTGASKMAHLYGRAFRNAGWTVDFLVGKVPPGSQPLLKEQLAHDEFSCVEDEGFFQLLCCSLIDRVARLVIKRKIDLVVSAMQVDLKVVGPASRRADVPYIVFDQSLHRFYGPLPLRVAKEWAFGREMRRSSAVIATSPRVAEEAVARFGCSKERVFTVPNGIVTRGYGSFDGHSRACDPQDLIRLLTIGRLDPQKGHLELLEALELLLADGVQAELSIVGDVTAHHAQSVTYAAKLRQYAVRKGVQSRVAFLGWRNDVELICASHNAYIHSALWEGPPLPLAVLEAMACRLPVVITDCAGWPDGFVEGVHGWVVPAGNVEALADAIGRMCRLAVSERHEMGEACRRLVVDRYDVAATGKQFVEICKVVAAGSLAR